MSQKRKLIDTDTGLMPSLGFLKKKRTKDSQGSNEVSSPTSPTIDSNSSKVGSPISQTLSGNSSNFLPEASQRQPNTSQPSQQSQQSQQQSYQQPYQQPQQSQSQSQQPSVQQQPTPAYTPTPAATSRQEDQPMQGQTLPSMQTTPSHASHPQQHQQHGYTGSQHDSAYSSGDHNSNVPILNVPASKPNTNPLRETKGKYTLTDFTISRTLGTGSFGRVHLVQSKHNQRFYAVKVLKKAQVYKMKQVEHTNDERKMLQRCRNPFLITLWGTWQDSKNLYMVMDFIEGGELFSLLRKSQVSRRSSGTQSHTDFAASVSPTLSPNFTPLKSRSRLTTCTA